MPYTIYKTNGIKLTTVEDGKLNLTTDLQLVGKNYAGYGQIVNENLVKLLENFANGTAPENPLIGQIWYDTIAKTIKVYSGTKWDQFSSTTVSNSRPIDLNNGEFWFDGSTGKLYIKHNGSFTLIGPSTSSGGGGGGGGGGSIGTSSILSTSQVNYDVIKFTINEETVAIVSPFSFTVDGTDPIITQYTTVTNGITLLGADPLTGVSSANNTYFWGTAADALKLNGSPATDYLKSSDVNLISTNITELGSITRISTGSPSTPGYIEGAWTLTAGSTLEATYADLAERYEADAVYEPGTVVVIGGKKEITLTNQQGDTAVAGVVSTNPAYKLNSDAGNDQTHPYIALKGRVPCRVVGIIKKGDMLVTSPVGGYATSFRYDVDDPNAVFARALEDFDGRPGGGLIEVKV